MATKTLLTVEDFMRLPESVGTQDVRYELVEGELVVVSPGMFPHNIVRDNVLVALRAFLPGKKVGTAVSEQGFQLSENTVRVPDVAFVRRGRKLATKRPIEGAPDLAIEVGLPFQHTARTRATHQRLFRCRRQAGVGDSSRRSRSLYPRTGRGHPPAW